MRTLVAHAAETLRTIAPNGTRVGVMAPTSRPPRAPPCVHLGEPVYRLHVATTGCAGPIQLYRCRHFGEDVTRRPIAPDYQIELTEPGPHHRADYRRRACHGCAAFCDAPRKVTTPREVSVVVPCHNYGRFLAECLESILRQNHAPAHVIVVDDASTDNTPRVAATFAGRGVLYLRTEFRDVAQARNAGLAALPRTPYVIFVDADDVLPPNYLAELLAGMTAQTIGFTYAHLDRFDGDRDLGRAPYVVPYDHATLLRANFATAGSLIRRQAFDQIGGWRSYRWGLHDWDLWLRMTAAGWQGRLCERAALRYRVHGASMSDHRHGHYECGADVLGRSQLTTIVTLACGRTWALDRWFAAVESQRDWDLSNLHLVLVDNSRDREFATSVRARLDRCPIAHTYLRDDSRATETVTSAELADRGALRIRHTYQMGVHLARLYALAGRYIPAATGNVWSIEDDVEVPPDALYRLSIELFRHQAGAVAGVLRSRFRNDLLSWTETQSGWAPVRSAPAGTIEIAATGFYCLLVKRDSWDEIAWRPGISGTDKWPYYDWAATYDIRAAGRKCYLAGGVRCGHMQADGTTLEV